MQVAKRIANVRFTQESVKTKSIPSLQLPDLPLYDLCRFLRLIIKLRIHMFQKVVKNLKNRWFRDGKAHVLAGICLISEGAGGSAKRHADIFRQMIKRLL